MRAAFLSIASVILALLISPACYGAENIEAANGVFFRVNDSGCNNGWIVFDDYVLVVDANFLKPTQETIQAIRQTTDRPIRFVFDTHSHGDHVFGNALYVREGATVVANRGFLQSDVRAIKNAFDNHKKTQPEFESMEYAEPSLFFDDRLVFEDENRRVELLWYGHGHTPGDAVAWLPEEKILFTGDLCVNGAFNYMGEANLDRWIDILEMLQGLKPETICPGHGPMAKADLLQTQKNYLKQLIEQVKAGVDAGKSLSEIAKGVDIPFYEKWTGIPPREANIRHAFQYLSGQSVSWDLLELGLEEGPSPTRDDSDWTPPKKMLVRWVNEQQINHLKQVAPEMEFVSVRSNDGAMDHLADADAAIGPIDREQFEAAKKLRWVHSISAGVEGYLFPEFVDGDVVLTNGQGTHGPSISDHVLGFMLMLSKGQTERYENKLKGIWDRSSQWNLQELRGKTILVLGLGGIGRQIAKRASRFDTTVLAVDPQPMEKPQYVQTIVPPDGLYDLLPNADFVVSTVPLTKHTLRYFDKKCFDLMKPTAYFINIGRGKTVNQSDLVDALQNKSIAGAALDVTDPEPLPSDSPLWSMKNVIITPHVSGHSAETRERAFLLLRENVRRFANGLPLLNVVDKKAGY